MVQEQLYHIYNRGNNSQPIYLLEKNYLFFLEKRRKHMLPYVDVLAYCLMPNHFHLLVSTPLEFDDIGFTNSFRTMLSSYTRAINKQESRTGSLFQQNTKMKILEDREHPFICFNYIHQNPLKAGLVKKMEDWKYSSFVDYIGVRNGSLCNKEMASALFDLPKKRNEFYKQSYLVINSAHFD